VPVSAALRPILEHHLRHYASEAWVTPSHADAAKPLNVHSFDTWFQRIVRDAELVPGRADPMGVTFHTLRHSFASWLAGKGVNLLTIASLLGDRLEEVARTYAHLSPDARREAVDALTGAVAIPALGVRTATGNDVQEAV
jgi:integrase